MIESVYNSKAHGNTSPVLVKIPKNVRQVGQVNDVKKIYVEDYVMSLIKKLGTKRDSSSELVVLLGQFVRINNCQCTFISGAIEIEDVILEDNLVFTNEVWTNIYETIKKFFTNVEIVGWSIIRAGIPLNVDERIRKVHVDNFAGQDKTLLLYDSLEREEAFYIFEENKLIRQDGYYIFYDRNAQMQDYIISLRSSQKQDRPVIVQRYNSIQESEEKGKEKEKEKDKLKRKISNRPLRKKPGLLYGVGAVAAVVALVFSSTLLNNYDKEEMNRKNAQDALSGVVKEERELAGATEQPNLPIETAQGKLSTINNDDKNNEEILEEENKESKKETDKKAEKTADASEASKKPEATQKAKETVSEKTLPEHSTYVVKKGDTLLSIAIKFYNSKSYASQIKELNEIEDSDMIKVGQKLLLP